VAARVKFFQYAIGAIPGPLDCYLIMRGFVRSRCAWTGTKRTREGGRNAVASRADRASLVPRPRDHPNHKIAVDQMRGFGGMVSVEVAGGARAPKPSSKRPRSSRWRNHSVGLRASLRYRPDDARVNEWFSTGDPDNFVRLSVGIEDADDLLEDLRQALS